MQTRDHSTALALVCWVGFWIGFSLWIAATIHGAIQAQADALTRLAA